ncbi:MAG: tyrosine-type recombinase/integrase [Acidobacteriaceae bacterium]|nr:tyrosine-type recombinase/integrase [Acidobacteriaceae bacterium]
MKHRRHSHATRQVDAGTSLKMVGDILGHRRPSSTSVYVRVALRRLRTVALPVPR